MGVLWEMGEKGRLEAVEAHNCMAAADSAVVLLDLDVHWDLARTH